MATLNIFDNDAFSLVNMTAAFERLPEVPTRIGSLGVFEEDGVTTRTIYVERTSEGLTLVAETPYGGPGEVVGDIGRDAVPLRIPHFQRDDAVQAAEVQGVRAFGSETELETIQGLIDQKTARHGRSFDFTTEYQRLGALSGVVYDKTGAVVINLFQTFDIPAPVAIDFDLGNAAVDPGAKCEQVLDAMEDELEGVDIGQVIGLAGDTFYRKLTTHPKVVAQYLNWNAAAILATDWRKRTFPYHGISWSRYHTRPKAKLALGNQPLIPDNGARFIITGVPGLYLTRFAPADYMETVNTIGRPRYAKIIPMDNDKGVRLELQANMINFCTRPESIQIGVTNS